MKYGPASKIISYGLLTGLASLGTCNLSAQSVTGWGAEQGYANGTVTDLGNGSLRDVATGALGERAVLSTPIDFSTVGAQVQLTASVTVSNLFGNQQFRFGLFNNNGNSVGTLSSGVWSGATTSGWLGYLVEIGNANGTGTTALYGRNGTGANAWLSTSGASYAINNTQTDTGAFATVPGTFSIDLSLTRLTATSIGIAYSLLETDGVGTLSAVGSYTDTSGLSSGISAINAVGFYTPNQSDLFSNVTVTPEPSTFALAGFGLVGLIANRCRKSRTNA